ncbi:MAG: LpxI family protein [Deltaproteobacteria bacterium]|nr:LpxI family protein [Deltaproteobacteria bacterium]
MTGARRLGIVAGGGQFPAMVARAGKDRGLGVIAAGFVRETRAELAEDVDVFRFFRLGQLGRIISFFKKHRVETVVFAGPVNKPRALDIRPDFRATRLLLRLAGRSDDSILRAVAREFEGEGMAVASALDIVPELATRPGILTQFSPGTRERADVIYGWPIAKELGRLDIGQCLVVRERMVVAVEGIDGTDATILRAGNLAGPGCVVVKVFKPGQDHRLDMPAVGLGTLHHMHRAGATCLAVESGRSLFFDPAEALAFANEVGISIVGLGEGDVTTFLGP